MPREIVGPGLIVLPGRSTVRSGSGRLVFFVQVVDIAGEVGRFAGFEALVNPVPFSDWFLAVDTDRFRLSSFPQRKDSCPPFRTSRVWTLLTRRQWESFVSVKRDIDSLEALLHWSTLFGAAAPWRLLKKASDKNGLANVALEGALPGCVRIRRACLLCPCCRCSRRKKRDVKIKARALMLPLLSSTSQSGFRRSRRTSGCECYQGTRLLAR